MRRAENHKDLSPLCPKGWWLLWTPAFSICCLYWGKCDWFVWRLLHQNVCFPSFSPQHARMHAFFLEAESLNLCATDSKTGMKAIVHCNSASVIWAVFLNIQSKAIGVSTIINDANSHLPPTHPTPTSPTPIHDVYSRLASRELGPQVHKWVSLERILYFVDEAIWAPLSVAILLGVVEGGGPDYLCLWIVLHQRRLVP